MPEVLGGFGSAMTRQRLWQIKMCAAGRCVICGKIRGTDGTRTHCRAHADAQSRWTAPRTRAIYRGDPSKKKANNALNFAIKKGTTSRPTACSQCGLNDTKINGHHHDYAQPLEVTWLCYVCHRKSHIDAMIKADRP